MPAVVLGGWWELVRKEFQKGTGVSGVFTGGNICHTIEVTTDVGGGNWCCLEFPDANSEGPEDSGSCRAGGSKFVGPSHS